MYIILSLEAVFPNFNFKIIGIFVKIHQVVNYTMFCYKCDWTTDNNFEHTMFLQCNKLSYDSYDTISIIIHIHLNQS